MNLSSYACVCVCVCMYTVEPLLADTPNSGHLPYNGQCAMYQLRFPYILYFKNLPKGIADTSE